MTAARVAFHPDASAEYLAAFLWYSARGTTIAPNFEREIDRALRLISQNPLRWPKFDEQRRCLIVRKFPYSVIYEMHGNDVVILAVAHARRRPYYWRERAADK